MSDSNCICFRCNSRSSKQIAMASYFGVSVCNLSLWRLFIVLRLHRGTSDGRGVVTVRLGMHPRLENSLVWRRARAARLAKEFDEVAAELGRTLDFFKVPKREKTEVLAAFAAHKGEVTAIENPKLKRPVFR